jgi:hypothetical protein
MMAKGQHWQDRSVSCFRPCQRLGEDAVGYWHPHDRGYDSRRPLGELGGATPVT